MNELSTEELDKLLEYAMEAMFILQDENPGDKSLYPTDKDLSLLERYPEYRYKVEHLVLQLLLCNEFERAKSFLHQIAV